MSSIPSSAMPHAYAASTAPDAAGPAMLYQALALAVAPAYLTLGLALAAGRMVRRGLRVKRQPLPTDVPV